MAATMRWECISIDDHVNQVDAHTAGLVTLPSAMGTLKSTRMRTRFPLRSRSSMESLLERDMVDDKESVGELRVKRVLPGRTVGLLSPWNRCCWLDLDYNLDFEATSIPARLRRASSVIYSCSGTCPDHYSRRVESERILTSDTCRLASNVQNIAIVWSFG